MVWSQPRVFGANDPKLRDSGVRRGSYVVGGKAVAEAAAVTHGAVLCSAWLGVSGRIGVGVEKLLVALGTDPIAALVGVANELLVAA